MNARVSIISLLGDVMEKMPDARAAKNIVFYSQTLKIMLISLFQKKEGVILGKRRSKHWRYT